MMKVLNRNFFIILFVATVSVNAQIVNGGFESWIDGDPVGWLTNNTDEAQIPVYPITQTTNANSGFSALKGEVISLGPVPQGKIAPLLKAGEGESGFPFSSRPEKLTGKYMYFPVGGDEFVANIFISRGDQLLGASTFTETDTTDTTDYKEMVFNIGYMDSTGITPNRIDIVFAIKPTDGIYPHEGSTFYIDDIPGVKILKPVKDELFIAGEIDTVLWTAGGTEYIDLEYSTDMGNSFKNFLSDYPADSGKYFWDVPDDLLTRKAMIRIIDSDDSDKDDTSDVFHIKPWQLTRIDANDKFELFEPNQDGWSFDQTPYNVWPATDYSKIKYTGLDPISGRDYYFGDFAFAKPPNYPSWLTFVDAFTIPQCYKGNPPAYFNPVANDTWNSVKDSQYGGACYGFAVTSLLAFYHKAGLLNANSDMNSFQDLYSVPTDSINREVISKYFTYQYGEPFDTYDTVLKTSTDARKLLSALKKMFKRENGDAGILVFSSNTGAGSHAVTPYKMERIGKSSTFNLKVYDSNVPGSENQIIFIDSTGNKWKEKTGLGWGEATSNIYLSVDSYQYLTTPQLSSTLIQKEMLTTSSLPSDQIKIYNQSDADVEIINSDGKKITFRDSSITNEIPNAVPKIPITGGYHPPIGYIVPNDNYHVELSNFREEKSYVSFFSGSVTYGYLRGNAKQDETDIVGFGDGMNIMNPDETEKEITLNSFYKEGNGGKAYSFNKLVLRKNDSLNLKEINGNEIILKNLGESTSYDLEIVRYSENTSDSFNHLEIDLNSNSSHKIAPAFNNLTDEPVKIMIDNGNDGIFDDTISVSNQVTGIKDDIRLRVPKKFRLEQNYPNPFNPTTTIEVALPESGNYKLNVYNILGQEIAKLFNGHLKAGYHSFNFDGSNLSTGVYIYTLRGNTVNISKKMILMK